MIRSKQGVDYATTNIGRCCVHPREKKNSDDRQPARGTPDSGKIRTQRGVRECCAKSNTKLFGCARLVLAMLSSGSGRLLLWLFSCCEANERRKSTGWAGDLC